MSWRFLEHLSQRRSAATSCARASPVFVPTRPHATRGPGAVVLACVGAGLACAPTEGPPLARDAAATDVVVPSDTPTTDGVSLRDVEAPTDTVVRPDTASPMDVAPPTDATAPSDRPPPFDAMDVTSPSDRPDVVFADVPPDVPRVEVDVPAPADRPDIILADLPRDAPSPSSCLPRVSADLARYLDDAPYASRSGTARMAVLPPASARWAAARDAALRWSAADCEGFRRDAEIMGYEAVLLDDTVSMTRHWVLRETRGALFNGVFAFRAPEERDRAAPLVIDSPHRGYDFTDARAMTLYQRIGAVAFLENTAHRCNLEDCSGCSAVSSYACGGCVRQSDVVHATDSLYYAVYEGLEAARDDLHFEYHGAGAGSAPGGCAASAHISQASSISLAPSRDDGTWPARFWRAMEQRLPPSCVCYHQRESGCQLNGGASTAGRRTNAEAADAGVAPVCTAGSSGLAGRFVHFEPYNVPLDVVTAAVRAALP